MTERATYRVTVPGEPWVFGEGPTEEAARADFERRLARELARRAEVEAENRRDEAVDAMVKPALIALVDEAARIHGAPRHSVWRIVHDVLEGESSCPRDNA